MKQITITPDLQSKLNAVVGEGTDTSGFAVFECIACNTLPFTGFKGTLNELTTLSFLTLQQAADTIQAGDSVPILWNHEHGSVPVGRAFWAEIVGSASGDAELRTLFYIDGTEPTLQAKLNASSIDEVSVGISTTQILCSECGWDYASAEATSQNFYDRVCANDHTVGTDGVHVLRNGLDKFAELSLVTRGAANGAKIVNSDKQRLSGSAQLTRLAARGFDPELLMLCASVSQNPPKKDNPMDLKELNGQLVIAMVEARTATTELTGVKASLTTAETALVAAQADVVRLTAELAAASAAAPDVAQLTAATTFLKEVYVRTLTAANKAPKDDAIPAGIDALVAGINEHQALLTAVITPGGLSAGATDDANEVSVPRNFSAFVGK